MKILQFHVDFIEYKPIEKEVANAEDIDPKPVRENDLLVLFTAVERGDDDSEAKTAIIDAKKFADNLKVKRLMIYPFAHLSQNLSRPTDAFTILKKMEEEAKSLGLETFRAPFGWNKALEIKVKGHPLAEMSRSYGQGQTLQVQKATQEKPQRQFTEHERLARIKRSDFSGLPDTDHRIIGEKLDLFSFQEPSPGMVYWHKNGLILFETLKNFIRAELTKLNYQEISTPALANTVLWDVSGHSAHYKDNMFLTRLGNEEFGLKPMNCPGTFLIYRTRKWSYKDLPVKYSTFDPLYRNELSGVASGLFRVKILTQDDAHIITTKEKGVEAIEEIIGLMERVYSAFGLPFKMKLSTRPDESMGSDEEWAEATNILKQVLEHKNLKYEIKEKEGNFYSPKIDVDIKDSLGREWQCCTIQADIQMPKKFKLTYVGEDGKEHTPIVIHRTIFGSMERFLGVILEHYKGKLPVWLAPIQARVIPVSDSHVGYGRMVLAQLVNEGVRAEGDFEAGTMSSKIKVAQIQKIPYMLIVGEKEQSNNTIAVRTREGNLRYDVKAQDFMKELKEKAKAFQ
ncbi:MAG: threonine--tRNA ligase [archaeon]|nr:threonine--tRNA ligase [archaeon]